MAGGPAERTTSKAGLRWLAPSATIGTVTRSASSRSSAAGSPEPITMTAAHR